MRKRERAGADVMGRLRRKFVLINMLLVTLVLLAVFAVLVASSYQQLRDQSASALRMGLRWQNEEGPPRFQFGQGVLPDGTLPPEDRPELDHQDRQFTVVPIFTVSVDEGGTVTGIRTGNGVEVTDELAAQAAADALAVGETQGVLRQLDLRYLLEKKTDGNTVIAFADRSWESASLGRLILTSLLVGLGALAVFFLISLFLSKLTLRPVEDAWRQQRQFVADASHELKTPLTVILANTAIVLSHREDAVGQQSKWVEYIRDEATQMKGLVEDLLFLARSDAAARKATLQSVNLSDLTTSSLLPFESVAFEAGVALESQVEEGLSVTGEEAQLRRLVLILLDNAVKYAGENGTVAVTLSRAQDKARLTVRNTGPVIPPEHLEHLFERFYRVDSARSRDAGGYGLGLAIAKTIVDGRNGKISVTSSVDGTVFTVLLPLKKK